MANYNKSFNFRNGVQVDTDKFIVNTAGLVGIGSTLPTDYLDVDSGTSVGKGISVKGDIRSTGLVTSSELYVSGISTILGSVGIGTTNIINVAADSNNTTVLNAGIITANFYYGSGLHLTDVIGFTTEGWNVVQAKGSSDVRSGLSTELKVGIGTTEANNTYDLVIGSDPLVPGKEGISFKGSTGDIKSTGNIEGVFIGNVTGNVSGDITGDITYSSGISSFTTLKVGSGVTISSGIATFTGIVTTNNLYVTGLSTFNDNVELPDNTELRFGTHEDLKIYHTTASGGYSVISEAGTGQLIIGANLIEFKNEALNETYASIDSIGITVTGLSTLGIVTTTGDVYVGGVNIPNKVGIGTTIPTTDFQLRKEALNTDATLQVISENKTAIVAVGDSESLTGHTGQFRYGHTTGNFKYSDETTLDVINYSRGNINNILNPTLQTGIGTGSFNWLVGANVDPDMTLTYEGKLGIGQTLPDHSLHIVGTSTVTSDGWIGGNCNVKGNLYVDGSTTIEGTIVTNLKGDLLSPNDTVLFNNGTSSGVDSQLKVGFLTAITSFTTPIADFDSAIGIGTTADVNYYLKIGEEPGNRISIDLEGNIGINTDHAYGVRVAIPDDSVIVGNRVGIGSTMPVCALDVGIGGTSATRYMIPPKVDNAGRTGLTTITGALIYNTQTNKLNLYTGDGWVAISTEVI